MFHTLVASDHQAGLDAHRFLWSVGFHCVAIAGAIALTRQASSAITVPRTRPVPVFVAPHPDRAAPPARSDPVPTTVVPTPSWEPFLQAPDLSLPILPTAVPTVSDLLAASALPSGSSPAVPGSPLGRTAALGPAGVWTAISVDDPVEVIEQPPLRYPPTLAQAGVVGRVELEYVVDTLGRAEPSSVRTLTSTRPEFDAAARAMVLGSRYRPARLHGQVVRQLVRQAVSFRSE